MAGSTRFLGTRIGTPVRDINRLSTKECIEYAICLLFSDDLKVLMKIFSCEDCIKVQLDLDAITAWA